MYYVLFVLLCVVVSHTGDTLCAENGNWESIKKVYTTQNVSAHLCYSLGHILLLNVGVDFETASTKIVQYPQEILFVSVQLEYFAFHIHF